VPQVAVIDINNGLIQSIRCDAGELELVRYDTIDIDENSDAIADRPLGGPGEMSVAGTYSGCACRSCLGETGSEQ